MVVTPEDTRADIAEAMRHTSETAQRYARSGHVGTHLSCRQCEMYTSVRDEQNELLEDWLAAP